MELGGIISDSLKYPSSSWFKVIILGIILCFSALLVPFLIGIIPAILALGYSFRILRASVKGVSELPEFNKWLRMFVDGINVAVVGVIYFIVPMIIMMLGMGGLFHSEIMGWFMHEGTVGNFTHTGMMEPITHMAYSVTNFGSFWIFLTFGIILTFILGAIFIIGIANMAYKNTEIEAAFSFKEIFGRISKIGWGKYIAWYILIWLILIIFSFIAGIISIIPVIGALIAFLVIYSYFTMFLARSAALIYES